MACCGALGDTTVSTSSISRRRRDAKQRVRNPVCNLRVRYAEHGKEKRYSAVQHNGSMDLETFLKLFPLAAGAFAVWKIVVEVASGRRSRFREDYRFAREFLEDIRKAPQMHPFLREKGYQALAGDNRLSGQEVEYLLALPESARALRLYVMGLPYLQHTATAVGSQVSFKRKYESRTARTSRKVAYLVAYGLFYALGAAPLFSVPLSLFGLTPTLSLFLTTAFFCWPLAALSLWSGMRITAAESLVRVQMVRAEYRSSLVPGG